jgi:hypothetical protein
MALHQAQHPLSENDAMQIAAFYSILIKIDQRISKGTKKYGKHSKRD